MFIYRVKNCRLCKYKTYHLVCFIVKRVSCKISEYVLVGKRITVRYYDENRANAAAVECDISLSGGNRPFCPHIKHSPGSRGSAKTNGPM